MSRWTPLWVLAGLVACGGSAGPGVSGRSYRMGFSAIPPRADTALLIPTLTLAAAHSDAGLMQLGMPWTALLGGTPAPTEVRTVRLPLADYYRNTGRPIVVALDVTDGLNRAREDPQLIAAGRSITDTAVQRLYREYVAAVDSILHPAYLSLAAETNLIRLAAPAPVYAAVKQMTNDAAAGLRAHGSATKLLVSVQVETAWGGLQGGTGYQGIAQDRADFPFIDVLGLSSYPYLGGYAAPADIPDDYYTRLVQGAPIPVLVLEGGWPSASFPGVTSTPALQAAYLRRQADLLDRSDAVGLFQITFTDLDTAGIPALLPFASLGLVDTALQPKPALAAWDSAFVRPLAP